MSADHATIRLDCTICSICRVVWVDMNGSADSIDEDRTYLPLCIGVPENDGDVGNNPELHRPSADAAAAAAAPCFDGGSRLVHCASDSKVNFACFP